MSNEPVTAVVRFYKRDDPDSPWEPDRVPVKFTDDLANRGLTKAQRAGDRWVSKDPARHRYEILT